MATMSECTRSVAIEVPAGEVEREATRIAQGIQKRARIPGFRPGKAPLSLVQKHFESKIREDVLETLVPAHLRSAFERDKLEPVSQPTLDKLEYQPGSPLKFEASFEVLPTFELADYSGVHTDMPSLEVTANDVERAIESMREQDVRFEDASADAVSDGLVAVVEARQIGPEPAEGEPAPAPREAQELKIGVGEAETLPAFSDAVRGMKPGEEREFDIAYPDNYPGTGLAGQTRRFHVRLGSIQKKVLPVVDDAWAKEKTGIETVAEMRDRIQANLASERLHEARHTVENAVVAQLLERNTFAVPETLVDQRIEDKLERNLRSLAEQGVDPRKLKLDWAKLRAAQYEQAVKDVRASLLLDRIAEAEAIAVPDDAVEVEVGRAAQELRQSPDVLRARLTENGGLDRIRHRMRQERVLEFLLGKATGGAFPAAVAAAQATQTATAAKEGTPA